MLAQSQGQLMSDHERESDQVRNTMRTRFSSPLPPFSLSLCSLPSRVTFVHSMVRAVRHREALGPFCMIPSRLCSGRDVHLLRGAESTTEVRHDADRRSRTSTHLRGLPVALDLPAWGRPRLRCSGCLCPLLHASEVAFASWSAPASTFDVRRYFPSFPCLFDST